MDKTLIIIISSLVAATLLLGAGCRKDCAELSMEACSKASHCFVRRSHIMGQDGQHNEEVACVTKE